MKENKPSFKEENKLINKGYNIIGIDEAGRGPLAGPVVASAVLIKNIKEFKKELFCKEIKDSKKISESKRKTLFYLLTHSSYVIWEAGKEGEKRIDKINILEATKVAMEKAVNNLIKKNNFNKKNCFLIIDGNFKINLNIKQKSIIKGDEKVFSCAAASIIAKVYRDRIMEKYHKKYPEYGFNKNKGYGTKFHLKMIKKNGLSKIHRKTFKSC